jgi:branched-subunit amino acid aminotransferase/4-amino-4-deoxychorismate lyase
MDSLFRHDEQWSTDNPKLLGPADHAFWMASMVFDGARAFRGLTPDLDLHCQRVLQLLQADGVTVQERTLTRADLEQADEIFSTGNYGKVVHVKRVEDRDLPYDALARRAHRLYMDYAESTRQA